MQERIRYKKLDNGTLESIRTYSHTHNGAQYKVLITPSTSSWSVVDAETKTVAATGVGTTLSSMQSAAREALSVLEVGLTTEKRKEYRKRSLDV